MISALSDAVATSICVLSGFFVVMYCSQIPGMVSCLMKMFFWCFAENLRNSYDMAAITGISSIRDRNFMMMFSAVIAEKTMTLRIVTIRRKLVPQRGCMVWNLMMLFGVSFFPFSYAWIVMCSAPWYWNIL